MTAIVLVRPHRWLQSWPGNYCRACGMDDPWEDAVVCPRCVWTELKDIGEEPMPIIKPCFFHAFLAKLPCEGYAPVNRVFSNAPIARERCGYPGRWFLVSADGLRKDGRRWWKWNDIRDTRPFGLSSNVPTRTERY